MPPTLAGSLHLLSLVVLFAALVVVPGWWVVQGLPGDGLRKLAASCLIGLTQLAVFELLDYGFKLGQWLAVPLTLASAALSARPLARDLRRGVFPLDGLATWIAAASLLVAAATRIVVYGLPNTFWDWCEHWVRARVFLEGWPITTRVGAYGMAARGPLFNAASALLQTFAGTSDYWAFQVASITLNATVCLPFALLLRDMAGLRQRTALLSAGLLSVVLPIFFWNSIFTWPKLLTATFILTSVAFYADALRRDRRSSLAWSLAFLAPGFLCHYLTFVYAAMLGAHLAWIHLRRRWSPTEPAKVIAASALLVAPWFAYLVANLGVAETFFSNTTMGGYYTSKAQGGRHVPLVRVAAVNTCLNFVPRDLCWRWLPPEADSACEWVDSAGEYAATRHVPYPPGLYWNGIYGALRASGVLLLLVVAASALIRRSRPADPKEPDAPRGRAAWGFLVYFLVAGYAANVLPVRWYDAFGTFNENLHAWLVVLLVVAAAGFRQVPRPLAAVLVLLFVAECTAVNYQAVALQEETLPLRFRCERARLRNVIRDRDIRGVTAERNFGCYLDMYHNLFVKVEYAAVYLRDRFPAAPTDLPWALAALACLILVAGHWRSRPSRAPAGTPTSPGHAAPAAMAMLDMHGP